MPSGVTRSARSESTDLVDLDNSLVASFSQSCTLIGFSYGDDASSAAAVD